jgi:hypothetical protein
MDLDSSNAKWMVSVIHGTSLYAFREPLSHRSCKPSSSKQLQWNMFTKALLQHVRDRWSIENFWHWHRATQLREDAHRYREVNGVQIMATLRSLAMNALRLDGFWPITKGLAALAHDIRGLLALLGWREQA